MANLDGLAGVVKEHSADTGRDTRPPTLETGAAVRGQVYVVLAERLLRAVETEPCVR